MTACVMKIHAILNEPTQPTGFNMNPLLEYVKKDDKDMVGFYHDQYRELYGIDTIGKLSDCPFPLTTDDYKVIEYGTTVVPPPDEKVMSATFALIETVKDCGHFARFRVTFIEGVNDFDHCGTKFTGHSYSIKDWANRINTFIAMPCPVCETIRHASNQLRWEEHTAKWCTKRALSFLDAEYTNWRTHVAEADVLAKIKFYATK